MLTTCGRPDSPVGPICVICGVPQASAELTVTLIVNDDAKTPPVSLTVDGLTVALLSVHPPPPPPPALPGWPTIFITATSECDLFDRSPTAEIWVQSTWTRIMSEPMNTCAGSQPFASGVVPSACTQVTVTVGEPSTRPASRDLTAATILLEFVDPT